MKAPYDVQEHFDTKLTDSPHRQVLESARVMGTGKNTRRRRVVYRWSAKRSASDNRKYQPHETQGRGHREGKAPMKKVTGAEKDLDEKIIERASMLAGLKGYVQPADR